MSQTTLPTPPESQAQRRWKYGSNVAVTCLVAIALAVLLTYLAEAFPLRVDTTIGGTQSLSPQTIQIISNLKTPIRIVALYPKLKDREGDQDFYRPVADLLADYASKGHNVTTELIDPNNEPDKFNALVSLVTNRFGGGVKEYRELLNSLNSPADALTQFSNEQKGLMRALPLDQLQDQGLQQNLSIAYPTVVSIAHDMQAMKDNIDNDLHQQIPSPKSAVEDASAAFSAASQKLELFNAVLESLKTAKSGVPKAIVDYANTAEQRTAAVQKIATGVLDRIQKLPPLKELDEFRTQLKTRSILIMSDTGYKILLPEQVWRAPEISRFSTDNATPRLQFAGEQQISMAIEALKKPEKQMVVFVRAGGPPLTMSMQPGQAPPFVAVAQELRDDNFDVQEKDASGQSQMQEGMQLPEPTDAQMKSAIWVVVRQPHDSMGGPSPIDAMLQEHLKAGGSAMVMLLASADSMDDVLPQYGIRAKTDYVMLHEALPPPARRSTDTVDMLTQGTQFVFKLDNYGDHPIAKPLQGLDFLTAFSCPVQPDSAAGVTATPLLPFPRSPHSWAASGPDAIMTGGQQRIYYNPKPDPDAGRPTGDIDNTAEHPLYGAAASEKPNGARVVVIGSFVFATSDLVTLPIPDTDNVARLPGNGEFFTNSIIWLAHDDDLLAISPHALQMARIRDISPVALTAVRLGVLTLGLPMLVILAGAMVYVRRQD